MRTPTTSLDRRFSDASAVPAGWDETRRALEAAELFWITTVRRDGRPHVTPLVAVWLDEALHFCTGPTEQKALNLRGNPRVALLTGWNDWEHGSDLVVEGEAVPVVDEARLERLAAAWRRKWDGRWQFAVGSGGFRHPGGALALVFAVEPARVLVFAKGVFGHTSHRF